jgi:hypothetical protein
MYSYNAYLIATVNIGGPFPIVTSVGIYSDKNPTGDWSKIRFWNIINTKGDTFQHAFDQMVLLIAEHSYLQWVEPLLVGVGRQEIQKLKTNEKVLYLGC